MEWVYLILAGLFEMAGVAMIKKWHHDHKITSLLMLGSFFVISFLFLAASMEGLPMGTAYAVWTGIGAAGGAFLGMILYKESTDWKRLVFLAMILSAAIGLKLVT
jgi:paired small multidrug resistance pump